jgi:hypothetical protein
MPKPFDKPAPARTFLLSLAALTLWAACSSRPGASTPDVTADALRPLLNSERIQLTFGSYGIDVLEQTDSIRISNLYSLEEGIKTGRTFAVVVYPGQVDPALAEAHRRILAGQSIGAVFKEEGWTVTKEHLYFGEIPLEADFQRVRGLMKLGASGPLAVHVYRLAVARADDSADYATIAEVHHPDFLTLADLNAIYGDEAAARTRVTGEVRPILDVVGRKMR